MSDQTDLLKLMDEITALPATSVKHCRIPLEIYLYEAERLHTRASIDLSQLISAGMDETLVEKLLARTKALRRAQLNWVEQTSEKRKAMDSWKSESPDLFHLRKDLLDNMTFAYRNREDLLQKLSAIKKSNSYAETIMDLSLLATLGRNNPAPLLAINYDLSQLDKASQLAKQMAKLRGNVCGRMYTKEETLTIRDKAYTLLHEVVNEIRSYGKFVFRNHPELRKAYASQHRRERNASYKNTRRTKSSSIELNLSTIEKN
jgi:hypothetical protein